MRLNGTPGGRKAFDRVYPDGQRLFEHVLVNHMFYEGFPYSEKHKNPTASFTALAAVYAFTRYCAIGCCALEPTEERLVDLFAALFRLIEHSGFDKNACMIIKSLRYDGPEKLKQLVCV